VVDLIEVAPTGATMFWRASSTSRSCGKDLRFVCGALPAFRDVALWSRESETSWRLRRRGAMTSICGSTVLRYPQVLRSATLLCAQASSSDAE